MAKDNNYEHFKRIKSWEEYFVQWNIYENNNSDIEQSIKEEIYNRYVVKSKVFQRANFKCQNLNCKTPDSPLTFHHIKFNKNDGKWSVRNGLCICNKCQILYHDAKDALHLSNDESIPSHVRGHKLQLDSSDNIRFKKSRIKALEIQKKCKHIRQIPISWELISVLLNWLFNHYEEIQDENEFKKRNI
jgi:hypothetical protein